MGGGLLTLVCTLGDEDVMDFVYEIQKVKGPVVRGEWQKMSYVSRKSVINWKVSLELREEYLGH